MINWNSPTIKTVIIEVLFAYVAYLFGVKTGLNYRLGFYACPKILICLNRLISLNLSEASIGNLDGEVLLLLFHLWDVKRVRILLRFGHM